MLEVLAAVAGLTMILGILWDTFESIVVPQRIGRRLRLARRFVATVWRLWSAGAHRIEPARRREGYLSFGGPLALLLTLAGWAAGLVVGFALLQWSLGSRLVAPEPAPSFGTDLYMSGTTFFTLGLGDVVPSSPLARLLTVVEAGMGFGFLALVLGYVPVFYQAYSRREVPISMLDERAGSPPTAAELLMRLGRDGHIASAGLFLEEWERWAADLMDTHLSYPILTYYRSQHENQSWLAALTAILDLCTLVVVGAGEVPTRPARLTFAIARHGAVDLSQVLGTPPRPPVADRLPPEDLARLRRMLAAVGVPLREGPAAEEKLVELRGLYEPYVSALSDYLLMPLPPWIPAPEARDNWQTTAWE